MTIGGMKCSVSGLANFNLRPKLHSRVEEVCAILARCAHQHQDVAKQLDLLISDDPIPIAKRENGHLYLVAQPLSTSNDVMVGLLTANDMINQVFAITNEISQEIVDGRFGPNIRDAIRRVRRAEGFALTSHASEDHLYESGLIDIVIRDDGGLSMICGRGTDRTRESPGNEPVSIVLPVVVLGVTHSVLALAGRLADQQAAYQGIWTVGIHADRLKGVIPYDQIRSWNEVGNPYSRNGCQKLTSTTTEKLVSDTSAVVERLLGPLLRGLGVDKRYLPYSTDSLNRSPR